MLKLLVDLFKKTRRNRFNSRTFRHPAHHDKQLGVLPEGEPTL